MSDSETIEQKMCQAILKGDIEEVAKLLEDDDCIDNQDGLGKTPLIYAMSSFRDVAAFLIEKGADLNVQDNPGDTALHVAVSANNEEMTRLLIEKGASLEIKNRSYETPIAVAVIAGYENMTKLLIDAGADVNVRVGRYNNSDTLLHKAVRSAESLCKRNLRIVKLLLDNGANVHAKARVFGYTPLYYAGDYSYYVAAFLYLGAVKSELVDLLKQYGASSMMYKWARPIHIVLDILNGIQ